jgi:hypothetical protein
LAAAAVSTMEILRLFLRRELGDLADVLPQVLVAGIGLHGLEAPFLG